MGTPEEAVNRRALGWLLLIGWPGVMTGISLTAIALLPAIAHRFTLANWAVAAIGSGVGGYLAPSAMKARPRAALCGLMFGAFVYFVTLALADHLSARF